MLVKEELLSYFIKGYIHIGKKDYLFFHNLDKFLHEGKNITSKQNDLFNKLIVKYQRQLQKQNFDIKFLLDLNWKTKVVPTDPELLVAKINLIDNSLVVKTPYNKKFSSAISNKSLRTNSFTWDKTNKCYVAPFTTTNFSYAYKKVQECFPSYRLCTNLQQIIDEVEGLNDKIWCPTLVERNKLFYILAVNENLYNQIKNFDVRTDLNSLYALSKFGIKINSSILNSDILTNFLNKREVLVNYQEAETILQNLHIMGINKVYVHSNSNNFLKNSTNYILEQLKKYGISFQFLKTSFDNNEVVPNSLTIKFSKSMLTHSNIVTDKVLIVANDTPIEVF